jgi:hypothetical protein
MNVYPWNRAEPGHGTNPDRPNGQHRTSTCGVSQRGRSWIGGCAVAIMVLLGACGDGDAEKAVNSSGDTTETLVPPSIGEIKTVEESKSGDGKMPPCRSLTAEQVTAVVGQPAVASPHLLAATLLPEPKAAEHCVFAPRSNPNVPGVMMTSSDDPKAWDYFTVVLKGSDRPLTPVPGIGSRLLSTGEGAVAFSKGSRSTLIIVQGFGPAGVDPGAKRTYDEQQVFVEQAKKAHSDYAEQLARQLAK